jgi:hypothetical protein
MPQSLTGMGTISLGPRSIFDYIGEFQYMLAKQGTIANCGFYYQNTPARLDLGAHVRQVVAMEPNGTCAATMHEHNPLGAICSM